MSWLLLASVALAQFVYVETKDVPVERVLANLKELEKGMTVPSPSLMHEIARMEAVAAVRGQVPVRVSAQYAVDVYWGELPRKLPWVGWVDLTPLSAPHQAHIEAAIARYRQVVAARPDDMIAWMGLGWCLLRSGDRAGAVAPLRKAASAYWAVEAPHKDAPMGPSPAAEAARYLLLALDPVTDAAEIADLQARTETLGKRLPRMVTPIVVPLVDRPLAELVDARPHVRFDLDGSGPRRWGWPGRDAAWLVWDPSGKGEITSGLQLFGAVTWWVFWPDGYAPLGALDDDGDGHLRGAELDGLALWRDLDQDGRSDRGEVRSLADWGIVGLGVQASLDTNGVLSAAEGVVWADGRVRPTWDWIAPGR